VREVGEKVKRTSELIQDIVSHASGLRAGIKAAIEYLLISFLSKGKKT
jgi:hypothetical protein